MPRCREPLGEQNPNEPDHNHYQPNPFLASLQHGGRATLQPQESQEAVRRLWVVLRPEVLTDRELRLLACKFAGHVLHHFEKKFPGDKRPRKTIAVAKRYAGGKATRDELERAWAAARAAEKEWQIQTTIKFLRKCA